jgi:nicotinamidase-related amidase
LPNYPRFKKQHFNALSEPEIEKAIKDSGRTQWLVTGIEAHIFVYQTVRGLLARNYDVEVVTDAISSRAEFNVLFAKQKLLQHGAQHTCVEMAVYELLEQAGTAEFKSILPLIK